MKREIFAGVLFNAIGDFFIESAVLFFIFGLLEKAASEKPVTLLYGGTIIGFMIVFLVLGCLIKTWRKLWNFQSG